MENGDLTMENDDLTMETGGLTMENGDLTHKNQKKIWVLHDFAMFFNIQDDDLVDK